ncbi:unnamed protein product [Caenorhabditis brenneri]
MTAPPAPKKLRRSEVLRMQDDSILCDDEELDSPFNLYFIKTTDGNPTAIELQNLEETFQVVKNAGVMPDWIDPESVDRLQSSDDFFVLPCFRGKFFRKLQAKKIKVYGPPIVLESINEQKQLPQWNHPVYSSAFEGAKISFTCIEPEKKRELYEKVAWMCGVVGSNLYHESTHLVAGRAEQTDKYKAAVNNSIKLMRKEWIEDLWVTSTATMGKFSALVKDAIDCYELKVFEGLEMAVTSIDGADRNNLIQLVEQHGGKIPGNMSKSRCKHLITDKTSGQKYTKAVEWGTVHVVQTRWVRKCIDLGHLVDEKKYHPKYLSTEHIRSSTPKKDATVTESGPDVSSIAGPGGRLCTSSLTLSSVNTQIDHSYRQSGSSFNSMVSTSNVASTTINSNDVTIGNAPKEKRRNHQQASSVVRSESVLLTRFHTSQSVSSQNICKDPIDDLRAQIDSRHRELFENCLFHICGVDETRMEKWRRFLNDTGATRAPKFASATNVVVVSPNQQERLTIRKYLQQEDITIVNVQWVMECVKKGEMISPEGFEWKENQSDDVLSPDMSCLNRMPTSISYCTNEQEPTIISHLFANRSYYVHPDVKHISHQIQINGGKIEEVPENAKFVVFGHSALMHELLEFDTVITDFYIETCIDNKSLITISRCPLFVPLPRPPLPIFEHLRFVLRNGTSYVREYAKVIIETNGGTVLDRMDTKSYKIVLDPDSPQDSHVEYSARTADFSWIIASMSQCRLQPIEHHLYNKDSKPLTEYIREDDVWMKCTREMDSTEEMELEVEERNRISDNPVDTGNAFKSNNIPSPYENPYFPDLRKPYKMNLNLDGVSEYINNMESPSRDTQESLTTSRVGIILRKAVMNTGRRETEKENEPGTCELLKPRVAVAENRRTVSSTPVLVRDPDRSTRYMPMDESFADQNQEHEELNRHYALHPHFLLSVSNMNQQESAELHDAIKQLGGRIEKDFNRDVTHLITSNMQRTPKVLSSIAAGLWCLTPDYVTMSLSKGCWLKEEPFEWCPQKLPPLAPKDRESRKILENLVSICGLWRKRVAEMPITSSVRMENRHNGAFSDWCVVIHHEDTKTQQIAAILEAGGAVVRSVTDYIEVSTIMPNKVFAHRDFKWNSQSARMLKADNIPIYVFDVIYEYLIDRDNVNFTTYLHPVYRKS